MSLKLSKLVTFLIERDSHFHERLLIEGVSVPHFLRGPTSLSDLNFDLKLKYVQWRLLWDLELAEIACEYLEDIGISKPRSLSVRRHDISL